MEERRRARILGVGLLAVGLVVGGGIGSAVGRATSTPGTTTTTTTSTTTPMPAPPIELPSHSDGPVPPQLGPITSTVPLDGVLVAFESVPDDRVAVVSGNTGSHLPLSAPGRIIAVGAAWVAFLDDGPGEPQLVTLLPLDGSNPIIVRPAPRGGPPPVEVLEGLLTWFGPAGEGLGIHRFDLDDPAGAVTVGPVVPPSAPAWALSRAVLAEEGITEPLSAGRPVLAGDLVAYDSDGGIAWFDRSTGLPVGSERAPTPPDERCVLVEGLGSSLLWSCPAGFVAVSPEGRTEPVPSIEARLVDGGRWMVAPGIFGEEGVVRLVEVAGGLDTVITAPGAVQWVRP
jgi:hypothetical protein